jgi:hypothetical protein
MHGIRVFAQFRTIGLGVFEAIDQLREGVEALLKLRRLLM